MRAPAPSFKSELAAFRQRLVELRRELPDHPEYQIRLGVLDRWENHASPEEIWNTIKPKLLKNLSAADFIAEVLQSRVIAERLKPVIDELPDIEAKVIARNKRHTKNKHFGQAAEELKLLAEARDGRRRLLNREGKTAPRARFEKRWGDNFMELCGQQFDNTVADLTNIAFDLPKKDERTGDKVRGTRKRTTRRAR